MPRYFAEWISFVSNGLHTLSVLSPYLSYLHLLSLVSILNFEQNLFSLFKLTESKVQLFWEGHKSLRNLPHGYDIYLVSVKTMRKIAQIFCPSQKSWTLNTTQNLMIWFFFICLIENLDLENHIKTAAGSGKFKSMQW